MSCYHSIFFLRWLRGNFMVAYLSHFHTLISLHCTAPSLIPPILSVGVKSIDIFGKAYKERVFVTGNTLSNNFHSLVIILWNTTHCLGISLHPRTNWYFATSSHKNSCLKLYIENNHNLQKVYITKVLCLHWKERYNEQSLEMHIATSFGVLLELSCIFDTRINNKKRRMPRLF